MRRFDPGAVLALVALLGACACGPAFTSADVAGDAGELETTSAGDRDGGKRGPPIDAQAADGRTSAEAGSVVDSPDGASALPDAGAGAGDAGDEDAHVVTIDDAGAGEAGPPPTCEANLCASCAGVYLKCCTPSARCGCQLPNGGICE